MFLFDQMLSLSNDQGLPIEELADLQMIIMRIVLVFLVVCGCLLALLLCSLIWNAFRVSKVEPEHGRL